MAECRQIVGEFYRIPKDVFLSQTRQRHVARPRQMAMTLAREMTDASFPAIARHFGLTDHTSAIHARNRIYDLSDYSVHIAQNMEHFRLMLATYKAQQEVTLMAEAAE